MALRIYETSVQMVASVVGFARAVAREDPDLARQMRRAACSVPLNIQEGTWSRGRNREARLHNALGSAKETIACLDVSAACGYVPPDRAGTEVDRLEHISATLWKLIHSKP
jgi:four helix bundle protein